MATELKTVHKMIERIIFWLLDRFAERYQEQTYLGDGNIDFGRRAYRFKSGNMLFIE
jgi:hypothetical protein